MDALTLLVLAGQDPKRIMWYQLGLEDRRDPEYAPIHVECALLTLTQYSGEVGWAFHLDFSPPADRVTRGHECWHCAEPVSL